MTRDMVCPQLWLVLILEGDGFGEYLIVVPGMNHLKLWRGVWFFSNYGPRYGLSQILMPHTYVSPQIEISGIVCPTLSKVWFVTLVMYMVIN